MYTQRTDLIKRNKSLEPVLAQFLSQTVMRDNLISETRMCTHQHYFSTIFREQFFHKL
jgi:hypothetical protein